MVTHKLLGATETTWGEALCVGAVLLTRPWYTFHAVLEIEDGLVIYSVDLNWLGLVLAARFHHTQDDYDCQEYDDGCEDISVGSVELEHL